jgi:uncharacterized protein (TIGR02678 family)
VPSPALAEHLAADRSVAVRRLLATPLLDAETHPEAFRGVVGHASWLAGYFDQACGWSLTVDSAAGFARLAKRSAKIDTSRPLRRTRGDGAPFDRRRYQLLFLACAELVRHPVTTVGLLASAVSAEAGLDTSRHGERGAFVDALRALASWGALRVSAGDVDAFVDSEHANAILTADTARLHRLLASPIAPSTLSDDIDANTAIERLAAEPRYGDVDDLDEGEVRNRWARHRLGRRVLDDPVVHLDELSAVERDYLASLSGRRWLRERVAEAGFELEERDEGMVAVDPDCIATDRRFPAPQGNAHQLALLLVDRLVPPGIDGRRLHRLDPGQLRAEVAAIMARFPSWARGRRDGDGPMHLTGEAIDLLVGFGLVRREPDGGVVARPALARYRVADPIVSDRSLFEEES